MADGQSEDIKKEGWDALSYRYTLGLSEEQCSKLDQETPLASLYELTAADVRDLAYSIYGDSADESAISSLVDAVRSLKESNMKELVVTKSTELRIILIGRTNQGKTTFANVVTNNSWETSTAGRCTQVIQQTRATWTSRDGMHTYDVTIIDTPGLDDSALRDERALHNIERTITELGQINAVLYVQNAEAPALDHAHIENLAKYRDIFGEAFASHWGALLTKFISHGDEDEDEVKFDSIKAGILENLVSHNLGYKPSEFFCIDSKAKSDAAKKRRHDAVDKLLEWVQGLGPIHTQQFLGMRQCEQEHIKNKNILGPLWFVTYEASNRLDDDNKVYLHLKQEEIRRFRTFVSYAFQLGIPGKFYTARELRIHGLSVEQCNELKGRTETLEQLIDHIARRFKLFIIDVKTKPPKGNIPMEDDAGRRHVYLLEYDVYVRYFGVISA